MSLVQLWRANDCIDVNANLQKDLLTPLKVSFIFVQSLI